MLLKIMVDEMNVTLAAAMGRSQSTPGLVESRGKVPLEEMWVPSGLAGLTPSYPRSLLGSPPRPAPDSPGGSTSSGRSRHHTPASQARSGKLDISALQPPFLCVFYLSRCLHSLSINVSLECPSHDPAPIISHYQPIIQFLSVRILHA